MADTPSDPHRHRYPAPLSLSTTTTRHKRPFHQTTLSSESSSSSSMSSSTAAVLVDQPNQNLVDQVETGSARKRARNSVTSATIAERNNSNTTEASAPTSIRRDSVDDDRRSFVTAYESSPERPSATTNTTLTGDSALRRTTIPPAAAAAAASSSSSPPPTGPPSSTTSSNASMSMPSRFMSIDSVGEPSRISIPPTRGAVVEEEEEDDRMDTDSPDMSPEENAAAQERGRSMATSSVPAPLYHPSSSPEPSSGSSSTARPSEVRNSSSRRSWRASPPAPTRPTTRPSPVLPDGLWALPNDSRVMIPVPPSSSFPAAEPPPTPPLASPNPRRSTPATSTSSTAQPRPLSLANLNGPYQSSSPYEFRSTSSARRFSDIIEPLRRSPTPPLPPSPPPPVPSRIERRWFFHDLVHGRHHRAVSSRNNSTSLAPLMSTTNADADSSSRNGPRLPPVIAAFPITESDSSDEELFDREVLANAPAPTRPFSRSTQSRPTSQMSAVPGITTSFASAGSYPGSMVFGGDMSRTSSQTPPPLVMEEARAPASSSAGVTMIIASPPLSPTRRHHGDDDIALEPDLSPPIFAGPDDHVHDHHDLDDSLVSFSSIGPSPSAPSPSDAQANEMLDMNQLMGFHQQVVTIGRLAENIGRNIAANRRTMQSAESELLDLYPPPVQNWRIAHQADSPEFEARRVRLRTAYSNMVRGVREAQSTFLDAERNLMRSRRELEAAMSGAAGLEQEQPPSRPSVVRARLNPTPANAARSRPVTMYDGLFNGLREENVERAMGVHERLQIRLRLLEEHERTGGADEAATSGTAAGTGTGPRPVMRARRVMQQRSASSAPSAAATPSVTVEDVPERTSQVRERAADGWSPLQISPFVPPPSPPRPLSRSRPGSRYSNFEPYWIPDDSVESIDEFDIDGYHYFRNMSWNRRQRPGQREAEETTDGSSTARHRLSQQIQIPPQPEAPPPSAPLSAPDPIPDPWSFGSAYGAAGFDPHWGTNPPPSLSPHVRTPRQHSELEGIVLSPAVWDFARPEVSPLTPSYPLPPAPRMVPRNLSMSEMQIRTGYTPQPSRNNSLVPPSPHGGLSPGLLGGPRSLLMGDRSPLPRMVEEPESMTLLTNPPEMTSGPFRGWTQDNIGRPDAQSRPAISITRSTSSSTSNPTSMEPELLLNADSGSPWLLSGHDRYTDEPQPAGFGNSLHVPLGFARPQSVAEDIRRRFVTRSRQRLQPGMSPSNPQATSPASSGPETAMQRASRFANQGFRRREDSLTVSGPVTITRIRRPVSIAEERPHTPSTVGPSIQPPGAPLDADNAATSFVRTTAERTGSPSPTRSSGAAASQERLTNRLRSLRRESTRPLSLSRPSVDSLGSDSSSSRDSYDRLRRSASGSFRDFMVSQRLEGRRSSGYESVDFPYESLDFPSPIMESVIGGGFAAFSPPPPGGLSSEEISALPNSVYKDSEEAKKEERCPICLDDYEETSEVMGVPECNHFFHKACLSQWLERNRSCPYCRKNIARRSNRRGPGSIGGRQHRPRPPPPPPGSSSSGGSWRTLPIGHLGLPDANARR